MAYRNKTYVCFDGDNDIHYYRLMCAWKQNDNTTFNFYDAHDLNTSRDSSSEESIKYQLRERLKNTSVFIVLIGDRTRYLTKFVKWEIEQSLRLNLPIIAVNLNGMRKKDEEKCPPLMKDALAIHISYNTKILQYALEHWPASDKKYRQDSKSGAYYYKGSVYTELGI